MIGLSFLIDSWTTLCLVNNSKQQLMVDQFEGLSMLWLLYWVHSPQDQNLKMTFIKLYTFFAPPRFEPRSSRTQGSLLHHTDSLFFLYTIHKMESIERMTGHFKSHSRCHDHERGPNLSCLFISNPLSIQKDSSFKLST
jgi:hypothetical protein